MDAQLHGMIQEGPQPLWILVICLLGFVSISKQLIAFGKWLFTAIIRPPKNLKKYGSWALITGSTDGIGKAFALGLAEKGLNLILVSRNSYKLKTVSTEIQAEFPNTKIKTFAFDFGGDVAAGVKSLEKAIEDFDVGVLINNVGVTYPTARYFHEVDEQVWMNIVRVNLEGTTRVTKAVLKGMLLRKKGAIVNIGSGAGIVLPSHPLYTVYAATKSYIDQFSRCLSVEYKNSGIDVQCQVPLYVATKMVSRVAFVQKPSLFIPSTRVYAQAAIRRIGYEVRCIPYWTHSLQCYILTRVPEVFVNAWRLSIGIKRRGAEEKSTLNCSGGGGGAMAWPGPK